MSATISHSSGAVCPSCGRFVGPLEKCPYCGANIQKRLPLKYLKLACLVLAIVGVALLVYAASGTATPTTKIGNVGATMNYAFVRIEGIVTRGPLYDADAGTLRFYVADETGELQATAFRDVTATLLEQRKIPSVGDKIVLDGTLRVRDDFSSLNVAAADKVMLTPPLSEKVNIAEIGTDDELRFVQVTGDVREIRKPYEGLTLITVGDEAGEIEVAVSADIEKLDKPIPALEPGDMVSVRAVVSLFRDEPQLALRQTQDLKFVNQNTSVQVRRIGELGTVPRGQRVRIAGKIERVSDFSQGKRAVVSDETGEIMVVAWQSVLDELAAELTANSQVEVVGELSEYRGEREIIPQSGSDVIFGFVEQTPTIVVGMLGGFPTLTPDPNATPSATWTPRPTRTQTGVPLVRAIGTITTSDAGKTVSITAEITGATKFSQGLRFTLDDGTGNIILLIWNDALLKYPAWNALTEGAQVRVIGKIEVFDGTLEIIPTIGKDIEVLKRPIVTPLAVRPVSSISTNDLDKTVLLLGTVAELKDFSAGKYVTLQDDNGTLRVVLFNNVWENVKEKVSAGAQMQVRGKVNVFAGKFEVVAEEVTFP